MPPPPRNKRNKKRKKTTNGPPAGAIRAAKRNAETGAASEVQELNDKQPSPAEQVQQVSSADAPLDKHGNESEDKGNRKRRADEEVGDTSEHDTELVFEDPFGDEFDNEVPDGEDQDEMEDGKDNMNGAEVEHRVFRPGIDEVGEREELVCDVTAYDTLQQVQVEWPALTVDAIGVGANGEYTNVDAVAQKSYPLSATFVMGTQASQPNKNKLVFVRLSNMQRTRGRKNQLAVNQDSDSDEAESDDDGDEHMFGDPVLQNAELKHDGTVNRVRVMPQRANIVAAWGESGRVSLYDAAPALDTLHRDNGLRMQAPGRKTQNLSSIRPFYAYADHRTEGFAVDWSRVAEGRLATGACNGSIYLCDPDENGSRWRVSPDRFRGHRGSVEDIQFSPSEANVFGTVGVDKSLRFWDTRQYRKPALTVPNAHDADVNVLSWNRRESHLVATGGDDNAIRVWDLRALEGSNAESPIAAAEFMHHTKPVSAVAWHDTDASMLVASSEDNTITVWDLAVERDAEEEQKEGVVVKGSEEFPPQLLFVHMGQKNIKDVVWHPSCTSLLVSTAQDGINVFKPSNITLPQS